MPSIVKADLVGWDLRYVGTLGMSGRETRAAVGLVVITASDGARWGSEEHTRPTRKLF